MRTRTVSRLASVFYAPPGGGEPTELQVEQDFEEAVPPRDWDHLFLKSVYVLVIGMVIGSITWSTVAIGSMLSMMAPAWVSYGIAVIFDLSWIICLTLEYLARYNPAKVRLPRRVGWGTLLVSMSAIFTYGLIEGHWVVGLFGALISAIAKSLWAMVMHHVGVKMSAVQEAWVAKQHAEMGARQAVVAARRQLARTEARIEQETMALALETPVRPTTTAQQVEPTEAERELARVKKQLKKEKKARRALAQSGPSTGRPDPSVQLSGPAWTGQSSPGTPPLTGQDTRPLTEIVKTFLASGMDPSEIPSAVLRIRPDADKGSVRRTVGKFVPAKPKAESKVEDAKPKPTSAGYL